MPHPGAVTPDDITNRPVGDVLAEWPGAARVFLDRRMGCVGCPFARFETVADVAAVYGLDAADFARALVGDLPAPDIHGDLT